MTSVRWKVSGRPVAYPDAVRSMEETAAGIRAGEAPETVWLLEHPSLFTAGTSARDDELIDAGGIPVYRTGRGGRYTWHGPGQQVAYVMLDLSRRGHDLHAFVADLEAWIIRTLACFGVTGQCRRDRVGVWVVDPCGREDKIAAIGIRVRRWVTFHGISINRAPDLASYARIVPCGIRSHGVTSLAALGVDADAGALREAMEETFGEVFRTSCAERSRMPPLR